MSYILNSITQFSTTTYLLFVILFISALLLFKKWRFYYLAWKIPGPWSLPIFGHMFQFLDNKNIIGNMETLHTQYGETVKCFIGPYLMVLVSNPQHVQQVLNKCLDRDDRFYQKTKDFIEEGIGMLCGEKWRVHRKLLNPAFHQNILNAYVPTFTKNSEILVKILKQKVDKPQFDIFQHIHRCSMDSICETAMNTKVNAQGKEVGLPQIVARVLTLLTERAFRIWLHIEWIWSISSQGREFSNLKKYVHVHTDKVIANKIKEMKNNNVKIQDNAIVKRKSFIEVLLEDKTNTFTNTELRHEIGTFVFAATDTIAVTTSYCLLCLGMFSHIQDGVHKELQEVFGDSERSIDMEDLSNLNYLDKVIKEVLRLYVPLPFCPRRVTHDLDLGDYILPAESTVIISLPQLHKNPKIWKNPTKFDPERFNEENSVGRHPYSHMPFLAGPRNCIGSRYAIMHVKVILASILRSYIVTTSKRPESLQYHLELVSKPIDGFQIMLKNRC